jgi:hypothetical protein
MVVLVLLSLGAAGRLPAQSPPVHYLHHGVMPPGAIGNRQLQRGGPLPGFFQPVEIKAPPGALVSLAVDQRFDQSQPAPRRAGLLIGAVYRLRVTNIRLAEGAEVFPTIEIIDRLYAPTDQQHRFPIPVDITEDDLKLAIDGKFVTRVIYLEDPRQALPAREDAQLVNWFEAAPGQDPLAVADSLGRPVAILRLGARLPSQDELQDPAFLYGSPPFTALPPESPDVKPQPATPTKRQPAVAPPANRQPVAAPPNMNNLPPPPELLPAPPGTPSEDQPAADKPRAAEGPKP